MPAEMPARAVATRLWVCGEWSRGWKSKEVKMGRTAYCRMPAEGQVSSQTPTSKRGGDGLKKVKEKIPVFRAVANARGIAGTFRTTPTVDPTTPPSPAADDEGQPSPAQPRRERERDEPKERVPATTSTEAFLNVSSETAFGSRVIP